MSSPNKKWWVVGLVVYLLSLPLLIWRSSRVGRTIGFFSLVAVLMYGLRLVSTWGIGVYVNVVTLKALTENHRLVVALDRRILTVRESIDRLDDVVMQSVILSSERAQKDLQDRLIFIETTLKEIEIATADFHSNERQRVKDRIIEIREQVKRLGRSIEDADIRKQIEEIVPGIKLLREEEKTRFLKDLSSIEFETTGIKESQSHMWESSRKYLSNSGASMTTGMVVMRED